MQYVIQILIGLIAVIHIYILWFEMFAWNTRGKKVFKHFPDDLFEPTTAMAANQGLYNGFLAAGLIWTFFISNPEWKISVSLFMIVIFLEVKVSILKWALAFIIATGIGNGLNYFYEPYKVIDFIYVEGSYELLRIGVFNIADLSYDIGMLMIIGYAVYSGLKKLQNGVYKLKGRIIKT